MGCQLERCNYVDSLGLPLLDFEIIALPLIASFGKAAYFVDLSDPSQTLPSRGCDLQETDGVGLPQDLRPRGLP